MLSKLLTETSWQKILDSEFSKQYFHKLDEFVKAEYSKSEIYPPQDQIFSALNMLPFNKVKVVLLGQDPYHGQGQANGLSFSVNKGVRIPPSLRNILKELNSDIGTKENDSGDLSKWATQGVLLLNSTLTVRSSSAGSHQNKGWEEFTDQIIKMVSSENSNIVFILWGSFAHKKEVLIDCTKHHIIKNVHPSPLSAYRGFFGSTPFSETNDYLKKSGISEINWSL